MEGKTSAKALRQHTVHVSEEQGGDQCRESRVSGDQPQEVRAER